MSNSPAGRGNGVHVLATDGPLLGSEADAVTVLGELYGSEADWVAIPITRLEPDIFHLANRKLGLFLQKLINYRVHVALIGDLSADLARSAALRDFVTESNRGSHVWFAASLTELGDRLQARG